MSYGPTCCTHNRLRTTYKRQVLRCVAQPTGRRDFADDALEEGDTAEDQIRRAEAVAGDTVLRGRANLQAGHDGVPVQ
eukprot:46059-Eustigmatos_ZCMA.PRE.1